MTAHRLLKNNMRILCNSSVVLFVIQDNVPSELPPWMKFLHGKLSNPTTPLNIRLFISKLIVNTEEVFATVARAPIRRVASVSSRMRHLTLDHLSLVDLIFGIFQVFRPYAKHWLGPLLQLVVSGNNGGVGIHFMVVDIVVTVLSWTGLATPKVGYTVLPLR